MSNFDSYDFRTNNLSFRYGPDESRALADGTFWDIGGIALRDIPIEYDGGPDSDWAKSVDAIESAFVEEYDDAEYDNLGLLALNLEEYQLVSTALNLEFPYESGYGLRSPNDWGQLRGQNWLDVGCGTGRFSLYAFKLGTQLTAVDQTEGYVQQTAQKIASLSYRRPGLEELKPRLIVGPVETLPEDVKDQDVITATFGVLNHCQDWRSVVNDLATRMNVGGTFVATMYGSPDAAVYQELQAGLSYAPAILTRRAEGGLLLGDDSGEVLPATFPYPSEVQQQLESAGLQVECVVPLIGVSAFLPRELTPENVAAFIDVIDRRYGRLVGDYIRRSSGTPESLMASSILADALIPRDKINEAPYFGIVATKVGSENA